MFTNKELQTLNSVTKRFSMESKYAEIQTFDMFVKEWYKFIDSVEKGYKMSIYDYTNDLFIRDLIEDLLQQIPNKLKIKVKTLIEPWDKRLDNATDILQSPIFRKDKPQWWWYRIPKKLLGELKEDIESSGLR